jgi:hypothetical protein
MSASGTLGLREFLRDYPLMAIRPSAEAHLRLKGRFMFVAHHAKEGEVQDSFALQIDVPKAFPKDLPKVIEIGGKIPPTGDYHVNQNDGTLCLGSPLSLLLKISKYPTLSGFAENCLVPYLFAISRKLQSGGPLPFGELAHGSKGMLADYTHLFGLKHPEQARYALQLLGMKKRRANKRHCPCGCGIRLGRCKFNCRLREFRALADRSWFRREFQSVG